MATFSKYIVLHCSEKLNHTHTPNLAEHDIHVHERIGDRSFLCRSGTSDLRAIERLAFVDSAETYRTVLDHPGFSGRADRNGTSSESQGIAIVLHREPDLSKDEILQRIQAITGGFELIDADDNTIRVKIDLDHLNALADIDCVRTIEPIRPAQAETYISSSVILGAPSIPPGPYTGAGELLAISDSGLDTGDPATVHPAFGNRVLQCQSISPLTSAEDTNGHGTHVAGCAVGNLVTAGDDIDQNTVCGTAPGANLLFQAISFNTPFSPPFTRLFTQIDAPGGAKATVHSDSWGTTNADTSLQYPYGGADAQLVDQAMWDNSDLLICFSIGNNGAIFTGSDSGINQQCGAEKSAKNSITVGDSLSFRKLLPNERTYDSTTGIVPQPKTMKQTSSKGPTVEKRLKPDVVAPGAVILSARSTKIPGPALAQMLSTYGTPTNSELLFSSGTSMACPMVAGCAIALREACVKTPRRDGVSRTSPSGALLKALLINGAMDLEGGSATLMTTKKGVAQLFQLTAAPNPVQGYGQVSVPQSLASILASQESPSSGGHVDHPGRVAGEGVVATVAIPSDTSVLTVTLAYNDWPGALIQIEVEIYVKATDGTIVKPLTPTDMGYLPAPPVYTANNVQKIAATSLPAGDATIYVKIAPVPPTIPPSVPFSVVWLVQ